MKEVDFGSIYNDFFGKQEESNVEKEIVILDINEINDEIDNLYIDDNSKEVLNKIVNYIKNYHDGIETKYMNLNLLINSDNKEVTDKIINILKTVSSEYEYVKINKISNYSLYKLNESTDINGIYEKSNIVSLYDLKAFNMHDDNYKKTFIFNLKEHLLDNNITIISGTNEEIKEFLTNDDSLENKYFNFKINVIDPSINEVCEDIINNISNYEITDELRISLLDYVTETFPKRDVDYLTYRDNLCRDISFNKSIPKLELNKSIDEIFKELNELVGLEKVKKVLYELVDLIKLKEKTDEVKINNLNLHMVFLGNPGTGKTTVARMICGILHDLKYIKQNKLIEVSSKDLVAEYVGQTAPKTMSVVEKAMGGVLFIDEAYALADKGDNTYNAEAIATLIKAMEDYRDNFVVIFAGYTKEMQAFLDSNSGIESRIGYTLEFDDYTNEELKEIFVGMIKKSGFIVTDEALNKLNTLIDENRNIKNFGNARFVRNVYEKTILKHASNTKNIKKKSILKTITDKDINY